LCSRRASLVVTRKPAPLLRRASPSCDSCSLHLRPTAGRSAGLATASCRPRRRRARR